MSKAVRYWGVIPAAGKGTRTQSEIPKQYAPIDEDGACMLDIAVETLLGCPQLETVVVALAEDDTHWPSTRAANNPQVVSCAGGAQRFESVHNALTALSDKAHDEDWVVVHDSVRPCFMTADLADLLSQLDKLTALEGDTLVGVATMKLAVDTLKEVRDDGIVKTVNRNNYLCAATPQVFRYGILYKAYERARQEGEVPTDECEAVERLGYQPKAIMCRSDNIKVTSAEDFEVARELRKARLGATTQ